MTLDPSTPVPITASARARPQRAGRSCRRGAARVPPSSAPLPVRRASTSAASAARRRLAQLEQRLQLGPAVRRHRLRVREGETLEQRRHRRRRPRRRRCGRRRGCRRGCRRMPVPVQVPALARPLPPARPPATRPPSCRWTWSLRLRHRAWGRRGQALARAHVVVSRVPERRHTAEMAAPHHLTAQKPDRPAPGSHSTCPTTPMTTTLAPPAPPPTPQRRAAGAAPPPAEPPPGAAPPPPEPAAFAAAAAARALTAFAAAAAAPRRRRPSCAASRCPPPAR